MSEKELTLIDTEIDFLFDMIDTIINDDTFFSDEYKYSCKYFKSEIEDKIKKQNYK